MSANLKSDIVRGFSLSFAKPNKNKLLLYSSFIFDTIVHSYIIMNLLLQVYSRF